MFSIITEFTENHPIEKGNNIFQTSIFGAQNFTCSGGGGYPVQKSRHSIIAGREAAGAADTGAAGTGGAGGTAPD